MAPVPPRRHYENSPIVEAVIDIQIDGAPGKTIDDVTRLADSLRSDFPVRLPVFELQMGFQTDANEDGGASVGMFHNAHQNLGWRLTAKDQLRVLQVRTTGFTFSRMRPYTDWETFSAEASRFWEIYRSEMQPATAKRLAVRMINKLPVQSGDRDLSDILNYYPRLPDGIPTSVNNLSVALQLQMKDIDEKALLNLGLYNGIVAPNDNGLILDLDLFIEKPVPVGSEVFDILNKIGASKNDIFEACITDKLRERIQ